MNGVLFRDFAMKDCCLYIYRPAVFAGVAPWVIHVGKIFGHDAQFLCG